MQRTSSVRYNNLAVVGGTDRISIAQHHAINSVGILRIRVFAICGKNKVAMQSLKIVFRGSFFFKEMGVKNFNH